MNSRVPQLFVALEKFCRGRPRQLAEEIQQVRSWLTDQKDKRPSGYMNHPVYFSAYSAYHLPLHLPELFWVLEQNRERLQLSPPRTILDLGCGPGTLSLSYLLWQQMHRFPAPESLELVDFSKKAVDGAKLLVGSIKDNSTHVRSHRIHLHDRFGLQGAKADWIFLGHVLNEWGSGPRLRAPKMEFVQRILKENLNPGGLLFVIEPPLREPAMDLMWMRDEFAGGDEETPVVAPCPGGTRFCPMLKSHMGWCYAQPPRKWADGQGLTPWDAEIRRTLQIRLEDPGFSYLVLRAPDSPPINPPEHAIAITDGNTRRMMICTNGTAKERKVPHRGAYLLKPTLKEDS